MVDDKTQRKKLAALLRRLMTVPPAIPHGRSDGFITAATENRRKECISRGFKILCRKTVFLLKHPHGHTLHLPFSTSPLLLSNGSSAHVSEQ